MIDTENIKRELEQIINILGRTKLFYNDLLYLSEAKSNQEKKIISENRILHEIRYVLWVLTVIELCKLFDDSKNQHFNFFKFLRKIQQNNNKLLQKTIILWRDKLNHSDISSTIIKLKRLRDKYYAHSDPNPGLSPEELTPSRKSIEKLISIGEEIIIDFYREIFMTDLDLSISISAGYILDDFIELQNYRVKMLRSHNF
jgi:hypothetical protein